MMEQKSEGRSRLKLAFFCVVGVHVAALMVALLSQGCKREQAPPPENVMPPITDTNFPPIDTNPVPANVSTSTPPPFVEPQVVAPVVVSAQEHVIAKGDTYSDLAKKYGVPVAAIQAANPGVDPKKLKVGQKINIPAASTAPGAVTLAAATGEQTYTVKSGDNLTKIAADHHTTVKAIQSANNLTDTRIKVGQKLKIPVKAVAPAPAPVAVPVPEAAPAPAPVAPPR
jgi:LysM repeat protein